MFLVPVGHTVVLLVLTQYNIGLKDQPVRENAAFPDHCTALSMGLI
jgi:hypothetical protein